MHATTEKVLFLVTGMTPAIITETIWALACNPQLAESERWVPHRVEVLSTEHGLNQIRKRLLDDKVFDKFKADYPQLANLTLTESSMHSIANLNGEALSDLKTPDDNEFAANQIHQRIRELTNEEHTELHVSIAGGRKTMGFYAGYALSLHGRAQDRMSHVLVDERFEAVPDFFYPTPQKMFVTNRDGQALDASKAQVWLAEIPFVRMKYAIKERHQVLTNDFVDTVNKINAANTAISLRLEVENKTLVVNNEFVVANLPPREFSFLCMFAQAKLDNSEGFKVPTHDPNMNYETPGMSKDERQLIHQSIAYTNSVSAAFNAFYSQLRHEDYLDDRDIDMAKKQFEQAKTGLKKHLEAELGLELAAQLDLTQAKRGMPFYLDIPAERIHIV